MLIFLLTYNYIASKEFGKKFVYTVENILRCFTASISGYIENAAEFKIKKNKYKKQWYHGESSKHLSLVPKWTFFFTFFFIVNRGPCNIKIITEMSFTKMFSNKVIIIQMRIIMV